MKTGSRIGGSVEGKETRQSSVPLIHCDIRSKFWSQKVWRSDPETLDMPEYKMFDQNI